jgi:dihydrofolate synthase/folylpolyglutamate synthase
MGKSNEYRLRNTTLPGEQLPTSVYHKSSPGAMAVRLSRRRPLRPSVRLAQSRGRRLVSPSRERVSHRRRPSLHFRGKYVQSAADQEAHGQLEYRAAIAYLHSLTDYEKTRIERYAPDTLDLARVNRLLDNLGNPHLQFRSFHVAGTKGKGSTSAMLESSLRAAGHLTGLYTSPHLHTFRERIQVAGSPISKQEVVELVGELRPRIREMEGITTFEAATAMAFLHFARRGVEVGVIEVGLGGRLDATNVLLPLVSIITSLSLDHTYLLGTTLEEIAGEKAGIVKPGVPVVTAPQRPEALEVIEAVCEQKGAPLARVGIDWTYEAGTAGADGQLFTARRVAAGPSELDGSYSIPLLGRHQLENALCAVAALDIARGPELAIPAAAVHTGLREVRWPGRLEILSRDPLVVVDCAHNPYSAQVLRAALEEWFPKRKWVLVYGASADKDVPGMLGALLPLARYVIATRSDHPRAIAPTKIADEVAKAGRGAEVSVSVPQAISRSLEIVEPDEGILVTGSIFLVADAREELARHNGEPVPDGD